MRAAQPDPHDAAPTATASRPSYSGAREIEHRARDAIMPAHANLL